MITATTEWVREPLDHGLGPRARETWQARSLVAFFARQAILKSIRRTVLGWLWLPLRGIAPTLVGSLVLGGVLGVQSASAPYPLFLVAGLIPWVLFALTASWTVRCLELSRRYTRAYAFPRLVLPLGFAAPALVDTLMFGITYAVLAAWYAVHGTHLAIPGPAALAGLLLAFAAGLGWGLILCIPGARARDVRFTLSFVLGGILAVTPVAYPPEMIPAGWAWLAALNPLAAIVETFRSGLLGTPGPGSVKVALGAAFSLGSLAVGLWVFSRFEDRLTESL